MKEQLIAMVAERAGIDPAKAGQAVDAVLGFLKENPDQLKGLVGIDPKDLLGEVKSKGLGGFLKR